MYDSPGRLFHRLKVNMSSYPHLGWDGGVLERAIYCKKSASVRRHRAITINIG